MRGNLGTTLIGLALTLGGMSAVVRADSVVMINVSGAESGTRNFTSAMNQPITSGAFAIGAVNFADVSLVGNQPGSVSDAFATNTHTAVTNNTGGMVNIAVGFAANDYSLPATSPLDFNASQTVNVVSFGTGNSVMEQFVGFANAANSLTPGAGTADATPVCAVIAGGPTNSCATTGAVQTFNHSGNFALNGVEMFSLVAGQTADFTGSINAMPTNVSELSSAVLLACAAFLAIPAGRRLNHLYRG